MANTIGTAYVNIAPNMSGIQGKIAGGLRGSGSQFANNFSSEVSGKSAVMIGAIAGVVSAATSKAMSFVSQEFSAAINRFDTIQNFPKVMQNFGIKTTDASDAMKVLVKGVSALPTSLNDIVSLTEAFTPLSKNVGEASKLALALNDALLAGGAPMYAQTAAMEQFRQALAKGKPQLQDWRSLETAMPAQLQQIAKALGLGTGPLKDFTSNGQGLYNAMTDGKISMQDFNNALLRLDKTGLGTLPNFQQQAKNASSGVATSFTVLKQQIQQVMVAIMTTIGQQNISNAIKSIGKVVKVVGGGIVDTVKFIAKYKDIFAPIAVGVGLIVTSLAAWAIAAKTVAVAQGILTAVMAMNPIGLMVIAIAGAVAGLTYFFKRTETGRKIFAAFADFMSRVWGDIEAGAKALADYFGAVWDRIKSQVATVKNVFVDLYHSIKDVFAKIYNVTAGVFIRVADDIKTALNAVRDFVAPWQRDFMGTLRQAAKDTGKFFVKEIIAGLKALLKYDISTLLRWAEGLDKAWQAVDKWFHEKTHAFAGLLSGWWSAIGNWFDTVPTKISIKLATWWEAMFLWFTALPGKIAAAFVATTHAVEKWFSDTAHNITTSLENWWHSFATWFTSLPGKITAALIAAKDAIVAWFASLGDDAGVAAARTQAGAKVAGGFIDSIKNWFSNPSTIEKIALIVAGIFVGIPLLIAASLAIAAIDIAVRFIGLLISSIAYVFKKAPSFFGMLAGWVGDAVGWVKRTVIDSIANFFAQLPGRIIGAIGKLGSTLYNAGRDLIQGLLDGAGSLLSSIGKFFLDKLPGWIRGPFKKALGIKSPSKVFAGYGGNITEGLVRGISKNAGNVTKAVSNMADKAVSGMSGLNMSADYAASLGTSGGYGSGSAAAVGVAGGPAVVQNNNIYNQVDLNTVTRELAWQVRH